MPTSPARSSKGPTSAAAIGFTASQLYSTASYASGDLTGIGLEGNDLTGWNFANQNLTNANFMASTLTNVDTSTECQLQRRDRQRGKLRPISGFTASQLYSTASYASGDLTGIGLAGQ